MSEFRDDERQRVYDCEIAAFAGTAWESVTEFESLVELAGLVTTGELWAIECGGRPVTLRRGRGNQRRSLARPLAGTITLAPAGCTVATLAHELAHLAAGPASIGHDARFRALYLAILRTCDADDAADRLAERFRARRLPVDDLAYEVGVDQAMARKVAALLDKAASTTFTAEGEVFTTKAMALMAEHRLDDEIVNQFRLTSSGGHDEAIVTKQLWFEGGAFINARTLLIDAIARENSCRVLYTTARTCRRLEVFGVRRDVANTLAMFALLTAHAATEVLAAAPRGNTLAFRRSFLLGYAQRAAERLGQARRQAVDAVSEVSGEDAARAALVALDRRAARVDEHVAATAGRVRTHTIGGPGQLHGFGAGRSAADRAPLTSRPLPRIRALNR